MFSKQSSKLSRRAFRLRVVGVVVVAASATYATATYATSGISEEGVPANALPAPLRSADKTTAGVKAFSALVSGAATQARGVSAAAVPSANIESNRQSLEQMLGTKEALPNSRVLVAHGDTQVIAFWNDTNICVRYRTGPDGSGGSSICSDLKNASDPNTPMAFYPDDPSADAYMLVPDGVQSVTASTESGPVKLAVENNVAYGKIGAKLTALSWTKTDGVSYVTRPPSPKG